MKKIGLGGFPLNDSVIQQMAKNSPNLTHIGIGGIKLLTSESILAIARYCTNLEDLNAHQLPNIDASSVQVLIQSCPKLKVLDLTGCKSEVDTLSIQTHSKEDW